MITKESKERKKQIVIVLNYLFLTEVLENIVNVFGTELRILVIVHINILHQGFFVFSIGEEAII